MKKEKLLVPDENLNIKYKKMKEDEKQESNVLLFAKVIVYLGMAGYGIYLFCSV